ncbi:MAG: NYN domain-containing protein [bacterium]
MKKENNYAFIDGQNLHLGIKECGWSVDYAKFRTYLTDKYNITQAYYFLGFVSEGEQDLYDNLQKVGFILFFREHPSALKGKKKGNVDCDIVFSIMKKLVEKDTFDKIFLVSGDGDYIKLVDYLIKKEMFGKILFPNRKFASSLYKRFGSEFYDYLENIKAKIEHPHK